uniref:Intracellular hyaluronan-binding protein 4 N-terminal domain-containing protein n=1 Tax=Timema poppense TaxID=170557 RepID=A0A7R9GTD0_TIMPO|nr:unnamed protein product [Timema poppensis]
MENTYGIGVTNRYALFLDEAEDPLEVLKIQEQEKEAKKKTKLSEKENKGKTESKGKPLQASRKGIKDTQNVKTLESGKPKEDLTYVSLQPCLSVFYEVRVVSSSPQVASLTSS